MKNFKKILSAALVATMALSMTACGGSFKAIEADDFADALDDADIEYEEIDDEDELEYVADGLVEAVMGYGDDGYYLFLEFDDADDAKDYFEDEYYDDVEEFKEDDEFDGTLDLKNSKSSGYILVDGEVDDEEMYGGFYFKDNIVVIAISESTKKGAKKEVDSVLDAIGYPKP